MNAQRRSRALADPPLFRAAMIGVTIASLALLLLAPLAIVFSQALSQGLRAYWAAINQPETLAALKLTLMAAAIAVPLNAAFGLAAAWALTKFEVRGKGFFLALLDLPIAVSPVVAGLLLTLVYGSQGWLGPTLREWDLQVLFAPTGVILATVFVTFPYVVRELVPVLEMAGREEEEAAAILGAGFLAILRRVTLPGARWGLLYGVLLCNARAMGEFGAVSVVSGHLRGSTVTLPLHVELLYNEYDLVGAFAAASLLAMLGLVTLVLKAILEWRAASP